LVFVLMKITLSHQCIVYQTDRGTFSLADRLKKLMDIYLGLNIARFLI